jgi:hypothetical protein
MAAAGHNLSFPFPPRLHINTHKNQNHKKTKNFSHIPCAHRKTAKKENKKQATLQKVKKKQSHNNTQHFIHSGHLSPHSPSNSFYRTGPNSSHQIMKQNHQPVMSPNGSGGRKEAYIKANIKPE